MHTYSVQFRIFGLHLDPREVTLRLGLQPSQVRLAGEKRSANKVWSDSLWSFDGRDAPNEAVKEWTSFEEGLRYVHGRLMPKKELVMAYAKSHEVIWWCGHFQSTFDGGPTLSVALLNLLGAFGAPLYIDNYFVNDET